MSKSNNPVVSSVVAQVNTPIPSVSGRHIIQKAISQRILLTNGVLELTVPGNSLLQAGDIITFDMPIMQPVGHNKPIVSNPQWSGRYLIYDMKHIINRVVKDDVEYSMVLRCVKDNVAKPYVAEHNSWTYVADDRQTHNIYKIDNELLGRMSVEDVMV